MPPRPPLTLLINHPIPSSSPTTLAHWLDPTETVDIPRATFCTTRILNPVCTLVHMVEGAHLWSEVQFGRDGSGGFSLVIWRWKKSS